MYQLENVLNIEVRKFLCFTVVLKADTLNLFVNI